jgi:2-polyprenyl-6-methoxyphenol hydroxylase-like FAD-dependent oxidoreductase
MSRPVPDVLVVGGGIGGLAAAYALRAAGHTVRVVERAAQFGEVGAGLQLAPNATRILAEWGLLDQVVAAGVLPARLVLADAASGAELTHLDLGAGFRSRYGAPYVVLHRSDLHRILLDACRRAGVGLETGREVSRVDSIGDRALTSCVDGQVYESAVVIGADGLASTLREPLVGDAPIPSGHVAYRGVVPIQEVPTEVRMADVTAWIGPGRHLVQYPLRRGEIFNQVAVFASPSFARGEPDYGHPEELDEAFSDSCDHVRDSLGVLSLDRRWPVHDRLPTDSWVSGRLALVGDAAHPMVQFLAQGACQAIEDAHILGLLSQIEEPGRTVPDWDRVLPKYAGIRAPRAGRVQSTARTWGEIWHVDGVGALLRDEVLTSRDPEDYRHIDWLYAQGAHERTLAAVS